MPDDVAENILKFIFHIFIEVICFYTGEIILFVITFGHKKPKWDYYSNPSVSRSLSKWVILAEISFWLGAVFWIILVVFTARFFIQN